MLQKKSIINTIKRAFQSSSLQLIGQQLTQFPPQLLSLQSFDLSDQNWWDCNPINKLDFSNNQISQIPPEIQKLTGLQVIRFKSNQLKTLPKEIFFETLKLLDVSKNKIEVVPKELYNAVSLVELNLSGNLLVECPNVGSIGTLEILYLENNRIESLTNLPKNLKRIDVSMNQLTVIKQSFFSNTPLIQQIFLNKNQIKDIQPGSFSHCNKLITLQMKENKLERFDQVPFSDKLDIISLNYNRIKQFTQFQNCPNLSVLTLADNKLEKLSGDIISLKKLKTLDISNNDLSDLPSQLGLLPLLVRIQLEGNPLKCIRPNIRSSGVQQLKRYLKDRIDPKDLQLKQKKTVDPKYNMGSSLDYWDKLIMEFTTGQDLDLKGRGLTEVDGRVWRKGWRSVNLSKNGLVGIGEEIGKMEEIRSLNLEENNLESLPQALLSLSTLQQLDIKRNKLSNFFANNTHSNLASLYFLDLSANKLTSLPPILSSFPRLRILHLSYNRISILQPLFHPNYFHYLQILDASNNQIDQISDDVWNRESSLNFLNLENNNLAKVPTVIGWMKLTALKVEGNPLKFIKRQTIVKGTVSILEDLRNKHVGEVPKGKGKKEEYEEEKREQEQEYIQTNINSKQTNYQQQQPQQYSQKQSQQYPQQKQQYQQTQQPKYTFQQINTDINLKTKKIIELENDIENNFSLNKIQKTEKKRTIQQLMVERSQLQQLLK